MTTASIYLLLFILACCRCENSTYKYQYYPKYHFGPLISSLTKVGWMNDPNGFCLFNNVYHLFYQYNPNSSVSPGIVHWGHAKSIDLLNWEHLPIALYPDESYDKDGVFSGSAIVEDGIMYLYYTGNVNHLGQSPDHEQHQILATSDDGETFKKLDQNPIIVGADLQPDFRDPKVWKHDDTYYMVLGNSFNNDTLGRALLFKSKDKLNWEQVSVLDSSDGFLGYMFECPDFFEIDNRFILLFSPQGVKRQGDKYNNLYSTGYIVGEFDYETYMFTTTHQYRELDHGHDFYATQTIVNKQDEMVLVAWMDMWEQNYPEGPDGFTGQLTIPRVLKLTPDGRLLQQPLKAIDQAIEKKLHSGRARGGTKIKLEDNAAKVEIHASRRRNFTLLIESERANDTVAITYDCKCGRMILDRGGNDGVRRTVYRPTILTCLHLVVYIDASSIEVFAGHGEVTMSSRFFPVGPLTIGVGDDSHADMLQVHTMKRTILAPSQYV